MKKFFTLLAIILLFIGCTMSGQQEECATDTITDDYGRKVLVPTHPQRIVSASPAVTEIICALGAESLLCGRTDYCTYPASVSSIPSIGGISNLNVEHVLSLKPDLMISASMVPEKTIVQLEKMNVPVVCVPEKNNFDGLYQNIATIGRLIGRESAADSLNALLRNKLSGLMCNADTNNRPTIYYVVGFGSNGNFTAGGNSFINDIICMAGARNLAEDNEGWGYSLENLMEKDPDYILIRAEDSSTFCNTKPYNRLTAVKNGRVISIESGIVDLQVPRNIEAIQLIHDKIIR